MARKVIKTAELNGENLPSFSEQGVKEYTINYHNLEVIQTDSDKAGITVRNTYVLDADRSGSFRAQCFYYFGGALDPAIVVGNTYYDTAGTTTSLNAGNLPDLSKKAYCVLHNEAGSKKVAIVGPGQTSINVAARHGALHYTTDGTTAPTRVTDANMPGNNGVSIVGGGASLGGYFFLGDINGQIHNSNLDDITTWNSTDFITAEREADVGMYIGKHKDHIVYIGTASVEFFYLDPTKTVGSPLTRRNDVHYRVGTTYANSIIEEGDVIYFVGNGPGESPTIYKLENFTLTTVDIPYINEVLYRTLTAGYSGNTDIDLTTLNPVDLTVYLTKIKTLNNIEYLYFYKYQDVSLAISEATGIISKWYGTASPPNPVNEDFTETVPIIASSGTSVLYINGYACKPNISSVITELGGGDIPAIFYSNFIDLETANRKKINNIHLHHYTTADSDLSAAHDVDISWKDFDVASTGGVADFSTPRTVSTNKHPARLYRCGTTRQRMFKLEIKDRYPIISGIEIDYDILGN